MQDQTEKPSDGISYKPPKSAYLWLAGIFAIVFAVIYIALVLFVYFVKTGDGLLGMNNAEAYSLYVFVFLFFLVALYIYFIVSRKELLFSLKRIGALMTIFTFVVVLNIVLIAFNPYLVCVSLASMLVLPFSKKSDAFVLNAFACWISSFVLIASLNQDMFPAIAFTLLTGMLCGAIATYTFPSNMTRIVALLRTVVAGIATFAVYFVLLSTYRLDFRPFLDNVMYIGISVGVEVLLAATLEQIGRAHV